VARRGLLAAALGLGAIAAWEAARVARVVRGVDPGGRADHADTLGTGLGAPLRLVLLGDSAVDGYGLAAEESLPRQVAARLASRTGRRVEVRSLAVSGAASTDVADFQVPLLRAAGRLDAVVVGVGVNDALQRRPADEVAAATHAIIDGLADVAPSAALAYVPCHDLTEAPGLGPVLRRVLGWRCRVVARTQRRILDERGVPIAAAGRRAPAGMFGDDGLHPGVDGIEVIASLVVGALMADGQPASTD
jgi:lysophospholipase L1-like esterase